MDWISDYEEDSLPVLNAADQLVGVLTVQDIMDYREEESREVYNKLAGISEGTDDDLDEPLLLSMKKRLPWLVTLLFLGMFVSSVVGRFEADCCPDRHPDLLPVADPRYGWQCGNPVAGSYHPGAHR